MKVKIVAIALFIGALLACAKGGDNSSTSLASIAVTPSGLNGAAGNTQQFSATGTYSDNSRKDLTSSATWTSPKRKSKPFWMWPGT